MPRRVAFVANARTGTELTAGRSDTSRVHATLIHPEIGACIAAGPAPVHDCDSRGAYEQHLLHALDGWRDEDQLVFYFSGHGQTQNGKYSLAFGDGASKTLLPFDNIIGDLQAHGVTRAVLIVDACESGAIVPGVKGARLPTGGDELPKGVGLLASSRPRENSYELPDGTQSLFTHLLLEGLESGLGRVPTSDGLIGIDDICAYIKRRLGGGPYASYPQSPVYSVHGAERGVWIAKNRTRTVPSRETPPRMARSIDELRFLYEQTAQSRHPCPNATSADLSLAYVTTFALHADMGPLDATRTDEELRRLGFYSPISPEELHRAAVLCFAAHPEIFIPQARSILVMGDLAERGVQRRDVVGPLPAQYRILVDGVEAALTRQGLRRDGRSQLFLDVAREAISNAIAHRDYARSAAIRVTVNYPSVEVVSPGGFPGGRTWLSLIRGEHVSNPVDAAIAWYLTTVLAFEGVGRGFKVFEEYVRTASESHLVCDEVDGASIRLRITLPETREPGARGVASDRAVSQPGTELMLTRASASDWHPGLVPAVPAAQVGRYRLTKVVGSGGAGSVYVAEDTALHRNVAIKLFPRRFEVSRFQERFLREARAVASLAHPGIVPIFDVGSSDDQVFIVMELIDGGTLREWSERRPYDPPRYFRDVASVITQVADALAYAHDRGVVHRDVKPENILIDGSGRARLADFGLARRMDADEARLSLTGEIVGTLRYMSPEQMSTGNVDRRADIYSLGLVLWELVARHSPFGGADVVRIFTAKTGGVPPPRKVNADVPKALNAIVVKATELKLERRYQSSAEMATALRRFIGDS